MPGELGDEETQQGSGYYEHRYTPDGDDTHRPSETDQQRPRSDQVLKVLKLVRQQE